MADGPTRRQQVQQQPTQRTASQKQNPGQSPLSNQSVAQAQQAISAIVRNVETVIVPENGGEIDKVVNADGSVTITVKPNSGYEFVNWEITGEYDIKGDKNSTTITITPKTDVKIQAVMKAKTTVKPTPTPGTSSPSTGVAPVMMAVAFVGSMAAAGYSFKKSSK